MVWVLFTHLLLTSFTSIPKYVVATHAGQMTMICSHYDLSHTSVTALEWVWPRLCVFNLLFKHSVQH